MLVDNTALIKNIISNRSGFSMFFFNGLFNMKLFFSNLLFLDSTSKISKYVDFSIYVSSIYTFLYINNYVNLFFLNSLKFDFSNFFASNYYLNRFLSFSLWSFNYNFLINYNNLNKRKLRKLENGRFGYLIGFKLHCLGRFSRKQRASSVWFRETKVPLNTLSATIDYGFFTVPIRNSAATVKVWLYRDNNYTRFYFKLI